MTRGRCLIKRDPLPLAAIVKRMWLDDADFGPLRESALESRRKRVFGRG